MDDDYMKTSRQEERDSLREFFKTGSVRSPLLVYHRIGTSELLVYGNANLGHQPMLHIEENDVTLSRQRANQWLVSTRAFARSQGKRLKFVQQIDRANIPGPSREMLFYPFKFKRIDDSALFTNSGVRMLTEEVDDDEEGPIPDPRPRRSIMADAFATPQFINLTSEDMRRQYEAMTLSITPPTIMWDEADNIDPEVE